MRIFVGIALVAVTDGIDNRLADGELHPVRQVVRDSKSGSGFTNESLNRFQLFKPARNGQFEGFRRPQRH